jgi:hypothetical protein
MMKGEAGGQRTEGENREGAVGTVRLEKTEMLRR